MTKQEYLSELNTHLMSLSNEERENAVRFYEEYFEDAGAENEAAVIEELGKPFTLAKNIICEQSAYSKSKSYANYRASRSLNSEGNSSSPKDSEPDIMPNSSSYEKPHTQYAAYNNTEADDAKNDTASKNYDTSYESYKENYGTSGNTQSSYSSGNDNSTNLIIGIIVGAFVGIPLLITVAVIFLCMVLGAAGLIIAAVVVTIIGIARIASINFGSGMVIIGIGIALLGGGLLCCVIAILSGKFIPWSLKKAVSFFKKYSEGVI